MRKMILIMALLMLMTCGPPEKPVPEIPARYYSYECAWCGFYSGSDQPFMCYLEDGSYHSQAELLQDPDHWYHFACCDAWWAGQYMCMSSGLCNTCLSFAANVPPQTAGGCSSEPWGETWNPWCSAWTKSCYSGYCDQKSW